MGSAIDRGASADAGGASDAGRLDMSVTVTRPMGPAAALFDGNLVGADYWSGRPEILSAGVGFADIVGLPEPMLNEEAVRRAGGAWSTQFGCDADDTRTYTSASTEMQIGNGYVLQLPYTGLRDGAIGLDGLPVVFSWPVDTRTLDLTDFRLTLSTGEIVTPLAVGPFPNIENNERNVVVLFGEFANRLPSSEPGARFPVRVEIVDDDTPLLLVGPGGQVESGVGLSWTTDSSPYDSNNGPRLVGAKINRIDRSGVIGEGVDGPLSNLLSPPNDELLLYDTGDFKIRVLTSGGFSPDGVRGVLPTDFETFFRLRVQGPNGEVIVDRAGVDYQVTGGRLRVVGLSDLGAPASADVTYDGCYAEDLDNYIDIVLEGDEAAMRSITHVEIPSVVGGYPGFYNPGGPGTTPFPGVIYTQPGPPDLEPVINALDDPMRVTQRTR